MASLRKVSILGWTSSILHIITVFSIWIQRGDCLPSPAPTYYVSLLLPAITCGIPSPAAAGSMSLRKTKSIALLLLFTLACTPTLMPHLQFSSSSPSDLGCPFCFHNSFFLLVLWAPCLRLQLKLLGCRCWFLCPGAYFMKFNVWSSIGYFVKFEFFAQNPNLDWLQKYDTIILVDCSSESPVILVVQDDPEYEAHFTICIGISLSRIWAHRWSHNMAVQIRFGPLVGEKLKNYYLDYQKTSASCDLSGNGRTIYHVAQRKKLFLPSKVKKKNFWGENSLVHSLQSGAMIECQKSAKSVPWWLSKDPRSLHGFLCLNHHSLVKTISCLCGIFSCFKNWRDWFSICAKVHVFQKGCFASFPHCAYDGSRVVETSEDRLLKTLTKDTSRSQNNANHTRNKAFEPPFGITFRALAVLTIL